MTLPSRIVKNYKILDAIWDERERQIRKWGEQVHPDGTDTRPVTLWARELDTMLCEQHTQDGTLTWRHILQEEVSEAFAEVEWLKLRAELIQVAAVCAAWVEDGDQRSARSTASPT